MSRDIDPVCPDRSRRLIRRLRVIAARIRAIAWKAVKLSGEEFVKGFANKTGALAALALSVIVVAHVLGVDPADAVRRMLGM
ncbi:hypothetical protein ACGF3K_33630 [Streptomyces sp. NPDC047980]|uniref:hypothetical protein n=1 Tax=Streptomyces sp. NPDC047980 TaxID=3365494 RepID=UPI003723FE79